MPARRWGWIVHSSLVTRLTRGGDCWHAHQLGDRRGDIAVVAACGRLAPEGRCEIYAVRCLGVPCRTCARVVDASPRTPGP